MFAATYRNPRLVVLILLVVISAGVSALMSLGRQEDPTITNIQAVVTTFYPSADPARVEALVTQKLEESLREVPEIRVITSTSSTGVSVLQLELVETVDPGQIEEIWTDAREKIQDARRQFPKGVAEPRFESDNFGAFAAIFAVTPTAQTANPTIMGRHAQDLGDVLRSVPGTKKIEIFGLPEEEILVSLDPLAVPALGLTPAEISAAVAAADAKVQSGRLVGGGSDILLSLEGEIRATDRLRNVVLRESADGRITRLGDIAEVTRGQAFPATELAMSDGNPAVLIAAQLEDGLQVDRWMAAIRKAKDQHSETLPASLSVDLIFDQSKYTADRLQDVATNMAIGVALVVGVLIVTLGLRSALIVALVLPLVSLATLTSLNFIGLPLHQMSVTGLIVALGLLVDSAIVMTDEIRQRLVRGMPREEAVQQAVSRLGMPLLASTVTTALSFTPMILLPGPAGDFVGAIAIAVVFMLGWSLVIALTVTPAIAGRLLPTGEGAQGLGNGMPSGWVGSLFRSTLVWSVRNPLRSVSLALVLPVTGFLSMDALTAQFFPGVDRDQFHIEVEMAAGTGIERTSKLVKELDAELRQTAGISQIAWTVGRSAPAFYYNIVGSREQAPGFAQALVTTESPETTASLLVPLQDRLNAAYPSARILVRGLVQGPPVEAPIELRLVGSEISTLASLGNEVRDVLLRQDAITIVRTTLEGGAPKVSIDVDETAANLAGLTLADIATQLQTGLEGTTGGSLVEASEELPVRVQFGDGLRGDLSRIEDLPLIPPRAAEIVTQGDFPGIPLSAIAEVRLEPAEREVSRRNGERVNTVQAFVQPGVLPEEALQQARQALADSGFSVPLGYRLEIGGDSDARNDVVNNLLAPLGLIVTLSIAVVVMTFKSFRLAGVTFVVAGLSAGLSILSLAVFNYPFGITAIIGVIGSIGVSINAALIILSGLQANPHARTGDKDAMVDVVMGSSRHIISTTVTTFGGFLPLILAGGGFWPPFAMSIAGGVLLSTVVSFYFTPQMFALVYPSRGRREQGAAFSADTDAFASMPHLRLAAE